MVSVTIVIEQLIVLIAHAISGIYLSDLKYSKKTTIIIWGIWFIFQGGLWCFGEFMLSGSGIKFLAIFVSAFVLQYIIFFATTKGKFSQRLFTILTYSVFFCIFIGFNMTILASFPGMNIVIRFIVLSAILAGILYYFLKFVCPLYSKWSPVTDEVN